MENSNENKNKHISVATKCNITLNFPALDIPRSIGRKAEFQNNFSYSVPYHIGNKRTPHYDVWSTPPRALNIGAVRITALAPTHAHQKV